MSFQLLVNVNNIYTCFVLIKTKLICTLHRHTVCTVVMYPIFITHKILNKK